MTSLSPEQIFDRGELRRDTSAPVLPRDVARRAYLHVVRFFMPDDGWRTEVLVP